MKERITVFAGQTLRLPGVTITVGQMGQYHDPHHTGRCCELTITSSAAATIDQPPGADPRKPPLPDFRERLPE